MTENTLVQPTAREKAAAFWRKHERKVLIATTVTSTTLAIAMRSGIAQHNAFLKEKGLYDEFYNIENTVEV